MVLLGALAVRDARLARGDAALPRVLPRARAGHGARHHQPLGRAHGDDGHRVHGPRAVPRRRDQLDRARERRPAHVEVARHRRRSARSDRQARRRRHALRAAQDELDAGRPLRRGRDRGGARALQQALECGPHDPALHRRGGRARARALGAGRRLDPRPAGRRRDRGDRCDRRLRLRGCGQGALPLHLERRLRLVSRGLQGPPLRRRCGRQARRLADAALRAALDPAARPSRAAARDRAHLGGARRGGRAGSQLLAGPLEGEARPSRRAGRGAGLRLHREAAAAAGRRADVAASAAGRAGLAAGRGRPPDRDARGREHRAARRRRRVARRGRDSRRRRGRHRAGARGSRERAASLRAGAREGRGRDRAGRSQARAMRASSSARPAHLVQEERDKLERFEREAAELRERLAALGA